MKKHRFGSIAQSVEDLLPIHMMALALDRLYQDGYEMRLDTRGYLNNAMKAVLRRHTGQEMVVAKKTDEAARTIMTHTDFDDCVTALLAVSLMLLKLVEEKLYMDITSQAILSATMIIADAQDDDNPDMAGFLPLARVKAGKMLDECLRAGFYNHAVIVS